MHGKSRYKDVIRFGNNGLGKQVWMSALPKVVGAF